MITVKCDCGRETTIYSTQAAADYLGISVHAMKYHIYEGHITRRLMGHSLMFTKRQLDDPGFRKHLREQPDESRKKILYPTVQARTNKAKKSGTTV